MVGTSRIRLGFPRVLGWLDVKDKLVWIDCEMTGLSLETDALIEVAALVTDFDLNVLGDGVDLVVKPPAEALDQMSEVVTQMHTSSGLLDELAAGLTLREVEEQVLAYVREFVPEPRKAPLAGNTVGTDRAFLARDMPELEGWMHYRIIDVSSIKELTRHWYPRSVGRAPACGAGGRGFKSRRPPHGTPDTTTRGGGPSVYAGWRLVRRRSTRSAMPDASSVRPRPAATTPEVTSTARDT
jgi:oligoribonuclease